MVRVKGQKGNNDATSVLFLSALHRCVDLGPVIDQGARIKLFRGEWWDAVCEDDDDFYLYYVESGAIEVGLDSVDGGWAVLYVRGPQDVLVGAQQGIEDFGSTRFRFCAVRNTVLVAFTYEQATALMRDDPAFLDNVLYALHMSGAQMAHRIANTQQQSSTRRILLWLEKLCEVNVPDADGVYRVPCNLTLDEMTGVIDVHYATLNKLMKALKDRGIANRTRTHLEISDRAQVRALLAEENPVLY